MNQPLARRDDGPAGPDPDDRVRQLAAMLDQRRIGLGAGAWFVEVIGIHEDGDELWVQLAGAPQMHGNLVLHLLPSVTDGDVIAALESCDPRRLQSDRILHVPSSRH